MDTVMAIKSMNHPHIGMKIKSQSVPNKIENLIMAYLHNFVHLAEHAAECIAKAVKEEASKEDLDAKC